MKTTKVKNILFSLLATLLISMTVTENSFAQVTTNNGYIHFQNPNQYLKGNGTNTIDFCSNHNTVARINFHNNTNTRLGGVYGYRNPDDGSRYFGFTDADGSWSYVTKTDSWTAFKINDETKMVILASGQVDIPSTRDASGAVGSGALEIGDGLRLDNNEIITNTNSALNINRDNNGDVVIDNKTFRVIANQDCVRIGSASTAAFNNYKLFVEKGILTEKVRVAVKNTSDWSDYVFEKDYEVMPIDKLEDYVTENKHLPNVPSAKEMVKDGLDVATMDAKLLEKIEEAHLYIIELHKEIEALKARMDEE